MVWFCGDLRDSESGFANLPFMQLDRAPMLDILILFGSTCFFLSITYAEHLNFEFRHSFEDLPSEMDILGLLLLLFSSFIFIYG